MIYIMFVLITIEKIVRNYIMRDFFIQKIYDNC